MLYIYIYRERERDSVSFYLGKVTKYSCCKFYQINTHIEEEKED